jgi:hypothetical protein
MGKMRNLFHKDGRPVEMGDEVTNSRGLKYIVYSWPDNGRNQVSVRLPEEEDGTTSADFCAEVFGLKWRDVFRALTEFEHQSLEAFAEAHRYQRNRSRGCRTWRAQLSDIYWYNARIWRGPVEGMGSALHGIRNDLGPTWLYHHYKPRAKAARTIAEHVPGPYEAMLAEMPLVDALWWFIDNATDDLEGRTDLFFALRERVRGRSPEPWECRGTAIYTEGDGRPGGAQLVMELHGQCEPFTVEALVKAHNRDAGFAPVERKTDGPRSA